MKTFITSDLHLGHANIIKYCNRPFTSLAEMNDTLISNWNSKVTHEDRVFVLGDFIFGNSNYCKSLIHRLNGEIFLIPGNHDKRDLLKIYIPCKFEVLEEYNKETFQDPEIGRQQIIMCHYPFETWDKKHFGSWHAHGHVHGRLPYRKGMEGRVDVGVDANYYFPLSYQEFKTIVTRRAMGLEDGQNISS